MKYWLMKTEPEVFSWDDLENSPNRTGPWDGVRNYQARNFMRDDFGLGDSIFLYHSSCDVPGIYGLAKVARHGYPDLTALDKRSEYYDDKSAKAGISRWIMVDVQAVQRFSKPATLSELRQDAFLNDMLLLRPGQRLSIQPVDPKHAEHILKKYL